MASSLPPSNCSSYDANGWTISAYKYPISNATQLEELQNALGFPLPEMTFGNNSLVLKHNPSGWEYSFDTKSALETVKSGELGPGDGAVKVGYADAWLKSRTDPDTKLPLPKTVDSKSYDWTYTTTFSGKAADHLAGFHPADPEDPSHVVNVVELSRKDPILFYAEIPLYEDELHDNGASILTVRVRVMPSCLFVLMRFSLRVDNVLFRTFDTRLYHSFHSNPAFVVLETKGWEAPYDMVKSRLPNQDDLTPITLPNFIAETLSKLNIRKGAGTGWRGLGSRVQVVQLQSK